MKTIKKSDLKYAKKSQELDWLVDEINAGGERKKDATWCLSPNVAFDLFKSEKEAMSEIIYSLAKLKNNRYQMLITWYGTSYNFVHEGSANETIKHISDILNVPSSWVERFMRGDEKRIILNMQCGLDNIIIL